MNRNKAIEILKQVQKENPCLQAVYLWGSILTNDYNPETSDIDALAIVDQETEPELKDILDKRLGQEIPCLKINFLYPSSLNGEDNRGITEFVTAESLLYDMPNWLHIAGQTFKKEDFKLGTIDLEEVISAVRTRLQSQIEKRIQESGEEYLIKGLARLCYLMNQRHTPFKVFSYEDLVQDSGEDTREVSEKIVQIRNARYPREVIKDNMPALISFLNNTTVSHNANVILC